MRSSLDQRRQHPVHHHPRLPEVVHRVAKGRQLFAGHMLVDFRVFGQQNQTRRIAASLNMSPNILESTMEVAWVFISLNQASGQRGGRVHRQPAFVVAAPQVHGLAVS